MAKSKTVAGYKVIPDDQKMMFRLAPRNGALVKASLLGAAIRNVGKLISACSDSSGSDEETFITSISMNEFGVIDIEFSVLPRFPDEGA